MFAVLPKFLVYKGIKRYQQVKAQFLPLFRWSNNDQKAAVSLGVLSEPAAMNAYWARLMRFHPTLPSKYPFQNTPWKGNGLLAPACDSLLNQNFI